MNTTSSAVGNTSDGIPDLPEGCLVMKPTVQSPWNNNEDIISIDMRMVFFNVKSMIIVPIIFIIGGPSNVLNMAVFAKHGLKHRINACLLTLSLVDLLFGIGNFCFGIEQLWSISIRDPPYLGPVTQFFTTYRLIGLTGFYWASLFVSSVIAVERCLCVVFPLRAKTLISTRIMWVILTVGNATIAVGYFWVTTKFNVICVYDEEKRKTSMEVVASEYYLLNRHVFDTLDVVVYGLTLPITAVTTVAIATSVTVVALRKSVAWRDHNSSSLSAMSAKEMALTKMLVYMSVQFIFLNLPNVFFQLVCYVLPEISNAGAHYNLYFFMVTIMQILFTVKTSFNIFFYLSMGSRGHDTEKPFSKCSDCHVKLKTVL